MRNKAHKISVRHICRNEGIKQAQEEQCKAEEAQQKVETENQRQKGIRDILLEKTNIEIEDKSL